MSEISLPNEWMARPYQADLFQHFFGGSTEPKWPEGKRGVQVWHRRAGKDSTAINLTALASQMRVGTYWHMLPTANQAKKVVWNGIDKHGRRIIKQAFPPEMWAKSNETEMSIEFKNGSIWQCVGSDNYDSLVGSNPVGVVFSEYSVADPAAWDFIRPILAENGGWALFIYTSRGHNHGKKLYDMAAQNPNWFCSLLTVDDTTDWDGNPIVPPEVIEEERKSGMAEDMIQQEFYCSFDTGLAGAFYTSELALARQEGRIGHYPHDPSKPVQTWWDIGIRDATSVICTQRGDDGHPVAIDYFEERNKGLDWWIAQLQRTPYVFDEHWGPHDMENKDWVTGKTRREIATELGFDFEIVPKLPVADGINATRSMLRVMKIDETHCSKLIDGLTSYKRKYDDKAGIYKDTPDHDWASHPADAARYMSVGWMERPSMTIEQLKLNRSRKPRVKRSIGSRSF